MEASPLPHFKPVANHSAGSAQQGAEQQSEGTDKFEQQLTNLLEQVSNDSNAENSDNNQSLDNLLEITDVDLAIEVEGVDALLNDNSDLISNIDIEETVASEEVSQVLHTGIETDIQVQPVVSQPDQSVPIAGNNLPPVDSPMPIIGPSAPPPPQNPLITPVTVTTTNQVVTNAPVIQQVITPARVNPVQVAVNNPVIEGEMADEAVSVMQKEIVSAGNSKQESNLQNNHSRTGTSIASSVAAAASQLQQVPLTTASANLSLPQAAFPVDSLLNVAMNPAGPAISSTVQSQAWSQGLTEQVAWMMRGNIQSAEIRLNPANLGPLEVKLSIEDDVARLSFVSSHAPVREALDAAMPRLREMLEQQGISLADVDVSQHSEQEQQSADEADEGTGMMANHANENTEQSDLSDDIHGVSQISMVDGLSIYA